MLSNPDGDSFRPLAGFWFLNDETAKAEKGRAASFRPLAGFWFLNTGDTTAYIGDVDRFRPLAGFWFLNLPRRVQGRDSV